MTLAEQIGEDAEYILLNTDDLAESFTYYKKDKAARTIIGVRVQSMRTTNDELHHFQQADVIAFRIPASQISEQPGTGDSIKISTDAADDRWDWHENKACRNEFVETYWHKRKLLRTGQMRPSQI